MLLIKNKAVFIGVILLLGCTISCSLPAVQIEIPQIVFEESTADFKITDSFSKFKFIQLEQTDDCAFDYITKMVDAEDCIVVKTRIQNELFCFDKGTGAFKCRIGNIGEGPGEYLTVSDFFYNNKEKSICVIDPYHNSILSYDFEGNFLYAKKVEPYINKIICVERSNDGYLMFANLLYDNPEHNNDAYTVIRPDGTYFSFDPFKPVRTKRNASPFAMKPATVNETGITFCEFLSDTLFRIEKGEIFPLYKLELSQKIPSKELVSQLGPYSQTNLYNWCLETGYFPGFNNVFETNKFILLEPLTPASFGYFWINKETQKGIRIPSSNRLDLVGKMFLDGKSIIKVQFSNEHELISIMPAALVDCFHEVIEKNPGLTPFCDELLPFLDKVDPNGNPIVIIYEH